MNRQSEGFRSKANSTMRIVSTAALIVSMAFLTTAVYQRLVLSRTTWTDLTKIFPHKKPGALVVFIFRPDECPASMNVIDQWNRLQSLGVVRVRGLMIADRASMPQPAAVLAAQNIHFPTQIIDEPHALRILESIGYSNSPVSIVIDSLSRLRATLPAYDGLSSPTEALHVLGLPFEPLTDSLSQ